MYKTFQGSICMKYYTRHVKKYLKGDMIFSENNECDGMYIIDKGRVRVYKTVFSNGKAKEVELCELGSKAMFGEMAMIDENRRSASVQALEPTTCTVITKKIFEDQLSKIPPWMVNMIKILVARLRDTNEKLRNIIEEQTSVVLDEDPEMIAMEDEGGNIENALGMGNDGSTLKPRSDEIIKSLFSDSKASE